MRGGVSNIHEEWLARLLPCVLLEEHDGIVTQGVGVVKGAGLYTESFSGVMKVFPRQRVVGS
jgi:hypothetical protein